MTLPAVDASTNKFSNTTDYEFDAVGNLVRDIHGRQFTFNGDNKQVEVRNSANQVVGEYKYDGLGKRIKKETATEYVVFVYDGLGKLIGEYSADGPPAAPTVNYTATDPLGSPRVLTNKQGEVVSRRDFMPFGEEVAAMAETHRTPGDKYGVGDGVRQKFTGYERDEETGLDFAEARYYYNNHGRFTAVDPLLASGKSADPQTFNRYAYTMNRPLILTDPTGLQTGETAPPQKAPKTDSDRLTPPAIDVGKDLPKGRNEWQIRVVDKQAIALNGEDIRDSEGKIVEENGKVFTNQNAILARITYAVIPPANVSEYGEVTAITMKEKITDETLNGKRQEDYERSIPLTKDGESGVWLGSDLVGTSSDAPNKPTSILKGTQTLELIVTINGTKNDPFPARKNTYEVNPKTNTIRITEVPINGDNNEDDLLENKR